MKMLKITHELSLPLDIITARVSTYGDSGAGKTTFARLLAEKIFDAGQRFCAIDLKNDWWGLKSSADGHKSGIPVVIFGGPRADVKIPIDGDLSPAGATLADTISSIDQPAIVDLDAMSRTKQENFLSAFLDRLYDANRRPMMLFCDEADRYAPQKPMTPPAILSLSSSEDIARRGRKRGIGSFWLTQRTAVLNKNVSEFANLMVVFRTPGSKDLGELEDRVGRIAAKDQVKEVLKLAPALEDGQAFFLSAHPKISGCLPHPIKPIQLPMPWTFDSSSTPGIGQRRKEPRVLAKADLAAVESKMAEQVKAAKESDPAELKRIIFDLRRQVAQASKAPATPAAKDERPAKIKEIEVPVVKDAQLKRCEKLIDRGAVVAADLLLAMKSLSDVIKPAMGPNIPSIARRQVESVRGTALPSTPSAPRMDSFMPREVRKRNGSAPASIMPARASVTSAKEVAEREQLAGPERRVLDSIAFWESIGIPAPCDAAVAFKAGYSPTSSAYERPRGQLRTLGLIEFGGGVGGSIDARKLTEKGRELAEFPAGATTLEDLHKQFMKILPGPERKLLANLIAHYPDALSNDQLASLSGYSPTSSAYERPRGKLRTLGLAEFRGGGVAATEILFPTMLLTIGAKH